MFFFRVICTIIVIWFKLLAFAGKQNNDGVFLMSNRIAYTDEMIASIFRRDVNIVRLALKAFEEYGMIEIVENVITIPNWNKHQSLDAYEKKKARDRLYQAERRAAQKALIEKSSDKSLDTSSYVAVSDKEEDKDKEKEYHSFSHSAESNEEVCSVEDRERAKQRFLGGTLGQNLVFLSDEQFDDLCDKLSIDELDKYMGIIVECEKSGKRYKKKSHYQAILDMAATDRRIHK